MSYGLNINSKIDDVAAQLDREESDKQEIDDNKT